MYASVIVVIVIEVWFLIDFCIRSLDITGEGYIKFIQWFGVY